MLETIQHSPLVVCPGPVGTIVTELDVKVASSNMYRKHALKNIRRLVGIGTNGAVWH
jgi:hypothetical protein